MDIKKIVKGQQKFYNSGRTKEYGFRKIALLKLETALHKHEKELLRALQRDLHKSASEAYMTELGLVFSELRYTLKHLQQWTHIHAAQTPLVLFPSKSFTVKEPYGVTLIMAPWNYPVLLCLEPLISALAAGNCVVLKPSAYAPNVSKVLAKMLAEIYPSKYVQVVEGGRAENEELLNCRFDKIFFTGGAEVGRLVLKKAAKHMTPVTLELGGKSPCIIEETANLKLAARRVAFGKLLNCGQTCVAPDYLLVQENIKELFLRFLEEEIEKMAGVQPFENPDYPKMVNEKHYERVMELLRGENIRMGGYGNKDTLQIAPTILEDVTLDSPIMQEEIFAPVLPVLTFRDKADVLSVISHFEHPLACYLFTGDKAWKSFVLRKIAFGGGCINDTVMHLATPYLGFGGVGKSGMGAYHGKRGFDCFSHEKSIVENSNFWDLPLRYQPYSKQKTWWIRRFL